MACSAPLLFHYLARERSWCPSLHELDKEKLKCVLLTGGIDILELLAKLNRASSGFRVLASVLNVMLLLKFGDPIS